MTETRTVPEWTGGASVLAVSTDHNPTIPDWTGMPVEAESHSEEERLLVRLDRTAFERMVEAMRLGTAT